MMRTTLFYQIILACTALPLLASAQTPAEAPPRLEKLQEGEQPGITISKPEGERKITQKREQGRVTEVKVRSGKSEYYLKPNNPAGSALRGDAQSSEMRAPQWKIKEFDLGSKKINKNDVRETEPVLPPASAPPTLPVTK